MGLSPLGRFPCVRITTSTIFWWISEAKSRILSATFGAASANSQVHERWTWWEAFFMPPYGTVHTSIATDQSWSIPSLADLVDSIPRIFQILQLPRSNRNSSVRSSNPRPNLHGGYLARLALPRENWAPGRSVRQWDTRRDLPNLSESGIIIQSHLCEEWVGYGSTPMIQYYGRWTDI